MTRLCTAVSHVRPSLRKIEWITFSTDLSARKSSSATAALVFPSAISRSTSRSRRVSPSSGDVLRGCSPPRALDDLGVDHGTTLRDGADCGDEVVEVLHTLLEEIGAPLTASLEEGEGVARVRVLAEHDDPDLGVRFAQPPGGLDPLVGIARRHAGRRCDVRLFFVLDGGEQRAESSATAAISMSVFVSKKSAYGLVMKVAVVGYNDYVLGAGE